MISLGLLIFSGEGILSWDKGTLNYSLEALGVVEIEGGMDKTVFSISDRGEVYNVGLAIERLDLLGSGNRILPYYPIPFFCHPSFSMAL